MVRRAQGGFDHQMQVDRRRGRVAEQPRTDGSTIEQGGQGSRDHQRLLPPGLRRSLRRDGRQDEGVSRHGNWSHTRLPAIVPPTIPVMSRRPVSWLTGHRSGLPSQPIIGPVAERPSLAAYSCGGSCGFGPMSLTAFPFHPGRSGAPSQGDTAGFISRLQRLPACWRDHHAPPAIRQVCAVVGRPKSRMKHPVMSGDRASSSVTRRQSSAKVPREVGCCLRRGRDSKQCVPAGDLADVQRCSEPAADHVGGPAEALLPEVADIGGITLGGVVGQQLRRRRDLLRRASGRKAPSRTRRRSRLRASPTRRRRRACNSRSAGSHTAERRRRHADALRQQLHGRSRKAAACGSTEASQPMPSLLPKYASYVVVQLSNSAALAKSIGPVVSGSGAAARYQ